MGISIFGIIVLLGALFIAVTSCVAIWHFNKMRKLHIAAYVSEMPPKKAKLVRVSCGSFLIINVMIIISWCVNGVAALS